jgi:hypothetical protein
MAKTALTQLQEQIEVIRQEAYADGFAAAMRAIHEFAAKPLSPSAPKPGRAIKTTSPVAAKKALRRNRQPSVPAQPAPRARRPQRGSNALSVSDILREAGSDFVRPAVIRSKLQSQKNVSLAFASIRHALNQLQARGEVERSSDGKSWRHLGPAF